MDVDTGGDDAVAMLMAGHAPELELVAVTVVHGNAALPTTLRNTLATLEAGGLADVPVYAGAARALQDRLPPRGVTQGRELPLPEPVMIPQEKHAVDFLIEYYLGTTDETILMPIGPMTNIALALLQEPRLAERIPRIVMMGGAYAEGNVTPSAEFNIYADPEAARVVFRAGIPITMIGLEVTAQALVSLEDAERIRSLGTPASCIAADLIAEEVQWFIDRLGWSGGQIYDACTVRTVCDISGHHDQPPNVDVGTGIDRERFISLLIRCIGAG